MRSQEPQDEQMQSQSCRVPLKVMSAKSEVALLLQRERPN